MKRVSPFGKFVRLSRMEQGKILIDMADALGVSPSMLSMAELGKKKVPKNWLPITGEFLGLAADGLENLRAAAERSNLTFDKLREPEGQFAEAVFG